MYCRLNVFEFESSRIWNRTYKKSAVVQLYVFQTIDIFLYNYNEPLFLQIILQ